MELTHKGQASALLGTGVLGYSLGPLRDGMLSLDVGQDSTLSNGHASQELVQLFIIPRS